MKYTVYLRTNKVNGMQYVGQTKNYRKRNNEWNCMSFKYANKFLQKDRKEYGLDSFESVIISECETQEEAWILEQKYIQELNTVYPNGYNRAYGGKTNKGGNVGYHNGKEFKKGNEPWNKGKHTMSEENKKHLSEMWKNGKLSKAILQINQNGKIKEWPSNKECKRNGYTNVYLYCNGKNDHKFKGCEWYYKSDYEKMLVEQPN